MNKRVMRRFAAKLAFSMGDFLAGCLAIALVIAVLGATVAGFGWLVEVLFGITDNVVKHTVGAALAVGLAYVLGGLYKTYATAKEEIEVEDRKIMSALRGDDERVKRAKQLRKP